MNLDKIRELISSDNTEDIILGLRMAYETVESKDWHQLSVYTTKSFGTITVIKFPDGYGWIGWYYRALSKRNPIEHEERRLGLEKTLKDNNIKYISFE